LLRIGNTEYEGSRRRFNKKYL